MQFEIILHGNETPEQINRCVAALSAYAGKSSKVGEVNLELRVNSDNAILELEKFKRAVGTLDIPESVGEKLAVELVRRDDETLAKLEAENPQFGQQPLPEGARPLYGDEAQAQARRDVVAAGPLALTPPAAPSPAAAEASASAPAAAPASIPLPPNAAQIVAAARAAAATPAPAGAVDAKGLPWDERIHASSRAKIADGSWRMKRGVQSHVIEAVEAELRAQSMIAGTIADPAVYAAGTIREIAPPPAPANGAPVPPTPAAPAPAPLPPGPPALTFGIVASRIGKAVTAGTLSGNVLSVKLAELGFPDGLHTVNARPDMWQKVLDTLGA